MAMTMTDTRPSFARLTGSSSSSEKLMAVPLVLFILLAIGAAVWGLSKASSTSQQLASAQHEAEQQTKAAQDAAAGLQKVQDELAVAKSAGAGTVALSAPKAAKGAAPSSAYGVATWGNQGEHGWVRVMAYALPAGSQTYLVWLKPAKGQAVKVGELVSSGDGGSWALGKDLPKVAAGSHVLVASAQGADDKTPGKTLFDAALAP